MFLKMFYILVALSALQIDLLIGLSLDTNCTAFYTVMFVVGQRHPGGAKADTGATMNPQKRRPRSELRDKSQIVKQRSKHAAKRGYQQHRTEQRRKRKGLKPTSKHR